VVVVEADEYDRSFLKLVPDIAVVTSMDPDHLDIYGTPEAVEDAFVQFSQRVKPGGCLISKYGLTRADELKAAHQYSYDYANPGAAVHAENIKTNNGSYTFDAVHADWIVKDIELHMGGLHNIENAIAAITVAKYLSIDDEKIRAAIADFKGVKRRFEYILKNEKHILIDDYAHHPQELKALISGVRSLFADRKLVLVFQPHLYSRTNDLANEFAESLDMADEVILLPIYPARELPMEGVSSEMLLTRMKLQQKQILGKEAMLHWMANHHPELVVMAGAGDIDALVLTVKDLLK
jgi:UDP-N-acetylmuramate--alanine ligase